MTKGGTAVLWKLWVQAGVSGIRPDGLLGVNFALAGTIQGPDDPEWAMAQARRCADGRCCTVQRWVPDGTEGQVGYEVFRVTEEGLVPVAIVFGATREVAEETAEVLLEGQTFVLMEPKV